MIFDDDKDLLEKMTYTPDNFSRVRSNLGKKLASNLEKSFPLEWGGVRLEAKNFRYEPKDYSLKEQKEALLKSNYLSNPVKADLYLYDSKSNQLIDKLPNKTVMNIPYYTNRGTFIHNGNEYTTLKQSRLRPGIYSRIKANGELESQFNIKRGTGTGYRITLEPQTSLYKLNVRQSNVNLYSILHDIGVSDEELEKAWGKDILDINKKKYDARALDKIHQKLVPARNRKATTREEKIKELQEAFSNQKVDKSIITRTLPFSYNA